MSYETLDWSVDQDGIATLTLNRPGQRLRRRRERPAQAHLSDSLAMFYTSIGDGKEGVAAFLEKRDPEFTGRASELPRVF